MTSGRLALGGLTMAEERRATAFHEAGHVTIAAAGYCMPVKAAWIAADGGGYTLVEWQAPPGLLGQRQAAVTLGGPLAQLRAVGHDQGCMPDYMLVRTFAPDTAADRLRLQIGRWLSSYWGHVEAVAAALLDRDGLDRRDLMAFFADPE